jgi:plasmid stabilization system protein ParE
LIRYKVHARAAEELTQAVLYLSERSPQATAGLIADYEKAIRMIRTYPEGFILERHGFRRHSLSRHSYSLVYSLEKGVVLILAFMHQKRRPGYWAGRQKK